MARDEFEIKYCCEAGIIGKDCVNIFNIEYSSCFALYVARVYWICLCMNLKVVEMCINS